MFPTPIRILVVDDYEPFRRFLATTLQDNLEVQVIHLASDGLEAVQKAEDLQPDLVLLDIGLPKLNGIEAARRIRRVCPKSKLLFVSQAYSADFVEEALSTGAEGYLVKTNAGRELITAVKAILRDEKFVDKRFATFGFPRTSDEQPLKSIPPNRPSTLIQSQHEEINRSHEAHFYSDDTCFLDSFTEFIGTALKAGNPAIVIATESHRESLIPRLHAYGANISTAIEEGRYISLDAAQTLSTFTINGLPDRALFMRIAGDLVMSAAKAGKREHARVTACGECAPLLWAQGNAEAAIRLEHLWDQIARSYDVDILCGYSLASVQGGTASDAFDKIRAEHSAVYSL